MSFNFSGGFMREKIVITNLESVFRVIYLKLLNILLFESWFLVFQKKKKNVYNIRYALGAGAQYPSGGIRSVNTALMVIYIALS